MNNIVKIIYRQYCMNYLMMDMNDDYCFYEEYRDYYYYFIKRYRKV